MTASKQAMGKASKMPVIKIGVDICSIVRIASAYDRFGRRFLRRILTQAEIAYVESQPRHLVARLAGRFAVKEAAVKALGTGWRGVGWHEFEIVRRLSGQPQLRLSGRAAKLAGDHALNHWEVSLSHDGDYASATVIAYQTQQSLPRLLRRLVGSLHARLRAPGPGASLARRDNVSDGNGP